MDNTNLANQSTFDKLQDKFTVSLDKIGHSLYVNMVKSERNFIEKYAKKIYFWHNDEFLNSFSNIIRGRTIVILNNKFSLNIFSEQNMLDIINTRKEFKQYLKQKAKIQNQIGNIGKLSTSMPIFISDNSKIDLPLLNTNINISIYDTIEYRTKKAFKSGFITKEETIQFLENKLSKKINSLQNAKSNYKKNRIEYIQNDIIEIKDSLKNIKSIFNEHKNKKLTIKISTGKALTLKFKNKNKKESFITTLASIIFCFCSKDIEIKEAHKRPNRQSNLYLIAEIDNFCIYSQ